VTDVNTCWHETSDGYNRLKSLKAMPLGLLFIDQWMVGKTLGWHHYLP
jgi:hypothetical protein